MSLRGNDASTVLNYWPAAGGAVRIPPVQQHLCCIRPLHNQQQVMPRECSMHPCIHASMFGHCTQTTMMERMHFTHLLALARTCNLMNKNYSHEKYTSVHSWLRGMPQHTAGPPPSQSRVPDTSTVIPHHTYTLGAQMFCARLLRLAACFQPAYL